MQILRSKNALRAWIAIMRSQRRSVAFIPTMGALHEGHLSLVKLGQQRCSLTVASIFVNPKQFGPSEDLGKYPRTEAEDMKMLEAIKTSAVYMPTVQDMYPEGYASTVSVGPISKVLEGVHRPQFFDGVATVVSKLLLQVLPDVALFGEKDYQQLQVIQQLVRDLDIPVAIESGPTIRESDGLAMSSRNRYLSEKERAVAPKLHEIMSRCRLALRDGKRPFATILEESRQGIVSAGFTKLDYLECCNAVTLHPATDLKSPVRLLAAAFLGNTRLIDNIAV